MIPTLRKATAEEVPYERPPEIQAALEILHEIPIEEVATRAANVAEGEPGFVPTECVLHFVRRSHANGDAPPYRKLFEVLLQRVTHLVPTQYRPAGSKEFISISSYATERREWVVDAFLELLRDDRTEYRERLDFYEIRFNKAMSNLRHDGESAVLRRMEHEKPMQYDENSCSISTEMENRLASMRNLPGPEENFFRFELLRAIDQLPPEQRRIIQLIHVQNMPIESKDPGTQSIAKLLGCTGRTVRNRRDRAYQTLRNAIGEEGSEQ